MWSSDRYMMKAKVFCSHTRLWAARFRSCSSGQSDLVVGKPTVPVQLKGRARANFSHGGWFQRARCCLFVIQHVAYPWESPWPWDTAEGREGRAALIVPFFFTVSRDAQGAREQSGGVGSGRSECLSATVTVRAVAFVWDWTVVLRMAAEPSSFIILPVLLCSLSSLSFFPPFPLLHPAHVSCPVGSSGLAVLYPGVHHHLLSGDPRGLQPNYQPHRAGAGGQRHRGAHLPGDGDCGLPHLHRGCLCGVVHFRVSNANNFLSK